MNLLKVVVLVLLMAFPFARCHAEETQMFLDGNPRYPLVYAIEIFRHYLDLNSCVLISGDENDFELSAQYISLPSPTDNQTYERRFRKNDESDGVLQVWDDYGKKWNTIYNPYDQDTIEEVLESSGYAHYRLPYYYMFKRIYQQVFRKPYEDDLDDEELERSVIIFALRKDRKNMHTYLWDDENYPCIWRHHEQAWHLDKSSVYVEMEEPPQYILRVLTLSAPQAHNNDIMPEAISSKRLLYDEEEEKMYVENRSGQWHYMPPDGSNAESGLAMYIGEAAFYLVYGERFYGASPKWHSRLNYYFDVFNDAFYAKLDGMGLEE